MKFWSCLPLALVLFLPLTTHAQAAEEAEEPPMLLGICEESDLREEPFSEWFESRFNEYEIRPELRNELLAQLALAENSEVSVDIFFGSWCGDSKREVPRWVRLMEESGIPFERFRLIAVDSEDEAYKQSPDGETDGMGIFRVPTFVIRRSGEEVGRIVEYPVRSLERDLLTILTGQEYHPNYGSYPHLMQWAAEGLLDDPNVSARGLAGLIRPFIASTSELGAAAKCYRTTGETAKAVKIAQMNRALNPKEARAYAYLAQAYMADGDEKKAISMAERALKLNDDPESVEDYTDLLKETLGVEEEETE